MGHSGIKRGKGVGKEVSCLRQPRDMRGGQMPPYLLLAYSNTWVQVGAKRAWAHL